MTEEIRPKNEYSMYPGGGESPFAKEETPLKATPYITELVEKAIETKNNQTQVISIYGKPYLIAVIQLCGEYLGSKDV